MAERIADLLGANLYETCLAGHGMAPDSMASPDADSWMTDALVALAIGEELGDSVLLPGTPTGGSPAAWLVSQPELAGSRVGVVVLMSLEWIPFASVFPMQALVRTVVGTRGGLRPRAAREEMSPV